VVTVVGLALVADSDCKFGTLNSNTFTVVASSRILCKTPAQTSALVSLEVTTNLQDYTTLQQVFTVFSALSAA
jgi:hypothetical protein